MNPKAFPNDATGDALRRLVEDGTDLSKPIDIDFHIAAPNRRASKAIAGAAERLGFRTEIERDGWWGKSTVWCTVTMVGTHDAVTETEGRLDGLARQLGGRCEGWGSFGNADIK